MATLDVASYNRAGAVYGAANVSAKSVIAVTTSMTGVILYNPAGSGKKLVIIDVGFVYTTAPAAIHNIGLAIAAPNTTVPTTLTAIGSGVLKMDGSGGGGQAVGRAFDAAALPVAPVACRWFNGTLATGGVGNYQANDRIDGSIILVPGAVLAFTVVTTTAVGMGHITWAEVPA